jgi:RNA polymerase sigma-70 factor (sigma-E family)
LPDPDLGQFDQFLAYRLPALYRYACVLTGNRHDAEDLVQEALTRTGAGWWRVRRKDDPEGYVRMAMVRIAANRRRRWGREQLMADPPDRPVDDAADGVIAAATIEAVLARLPRRMRAVLALRYLDQLSDEEIGQVLGCSPSTVRSQAARALAKLRAAAAAEAAEQVDRENHHG